MAYTRAEKEGRQPVVRKPTRQEIALKNSTEKKGVQLGRVDLNMLDIHSLVNELIAKYNQKNDTGIIRSWFKRNRLEGQEKHLQALLSLVRQIREHSADLLEYKAHLMTKQGTLDQIIIGKTENAQFAVDRQREEHQSFLVHQETERKRAMLDLERIRLENAQTKAETRLIELRGDLIEKVTEELDLENISPPQAFVLIKALNQGNTEADLFMAQEQLDLMKAEVKQANTKADHDQWKFEQDKDDG